MDFLPEDIVSWKENDNFKSAKQIVEHLNFVNDSTERWVKLSTDYVSAAKGEEHFQNVLQVVEDNRKMKPNLRKRQKPE